MGYISTIEFRYGKNRSDGDWPIVNNAVWFEVASN